MCSNNLPSAVIAEWENPLHSALQRLITQRQDALEATAWAELFQNALSIPAIQSEIREGG